MKNDELYIDKITGELVRKSGLDEPSNDFTANVMMFICQLETKTNVSFLKKYFWYIFSSVTFLIITGLFTLYYFNSFGYLSAFFVRLINSIVLFLQSIVELLTPVFQYKASPILIASIIAILLLTLIDSLFSRKKLL